MLTVGGTYVEDVPVAAAWVHFVRSEYAHGRILSYDVDDAKKVPGVLGVFTGADLDLPPFPHVQPILKTGSERPLIAKGTVRFVGEPVVAVVAVDRHTAVDAAAMVYVDIEPLTAVVESTTPWPTDTLVHPDLGTNTYATFASEHTADFSECEVVLDLRVVNQRINGSPIEPRSGLAYWEPDPDGDRLVHYSACQGAHPTRDILATLYELPVDRVRAVVPDVGGGFGVKSRTIGEELTLGWLSTQVGKPVRYTETRTEAMQAMPQGRGQRIDVKIGGTRDGRITAYHLDVVQDAGAYPLMGAYLPMMTQRMTPVSTTFPTARSMVCRWRPTRCRSRRTAVPAAQRQRSPSSGRSTTSRPRSAWTPPRCADATSSPSSWSRTRPESARSTTSATTARQCVRGARRRRLRRSLRAEQAARRASGSTVQTGIGIAVYVEITSGCRRLPSTAPSHLLAGWRAAGAHRRHAVRAGSRDHLEDDHLPTALGVPMDAVDVCTATPTRVPRGGFDRRIALGAGRRPSLAIAATKLADARTRTRRQMLEAAVDDVVLDADAGTFHVAGRRCPRSAGPTWPVATVNRWSGSATSRRATRPFRSVPTSPWSRSTPRPARSRCSDSSRSTTPARC